MAELVYAGDWLCCATTLQCLFLLVAQLEIASSNLARSTMYKVMKLIHKKYGNVIEITRDDFGEFESPFPAFHQAKYLRRLWLEEGLTKVKILIDSQILTVRQAEVWAANEYKSLPKCRWCIKILGTDVFTHRLCGNSLFCTQDCADKDYQSYLEKMCDEDDIDYV